MYPHDIPILIFSHVSKPPPRMAVGRPCRTPTAMHRGLVTMVDVGDEHIDLGPENGGFNLEIWVSLIF